MRRLLIAACAVVITSPVFADQLFDTCFKMATDRVGPIGQTAHGHFQKFVRECVRGKIVTEAAASVRAGRVVDGGGPDSEDGRIKCVTGANGQRYCY